MTFAFDRKDRSVQAGVRRIARAEARAALACLRSDLTANPEAVHAVRKASKKLRGLLRLVRPGFDGAKAESAALRDTARHLSTLRDAEVMRRTFERLAEKLPDEANEALRARLDQRKAQIADPDALAEAIAAMTAAFEGIEARARKWKIRGKEFDALAPGLIATRKRARKGLKRAQRAARDDTLPAEAFHDWRKQVKHHWYQARLLAPIWPEILTPHVAQADLLGETLGDHNDLDILLTTLEGDPALADHPALSPLRVEVMAQRRKLAAQSLVLGARLLAEPPEALADRWGRWWGLWRG